MKITRIVYNQLVNGVTIPREIAAILWRDQNGNDKELFFYKSIGKYSTFRGTWFPFEGMAEKNSEFCERGTFIAPVFQWSSKRNNFNQLDKNSNTLLRKIHLKMIGIPGSKLHYRFGGSLPLILISSWLGGGFWNEELGIRIKHRLVKEYPDFFKLWRQPEFSSISKTFENEKIEEINQWLMNFAGVRHVDKLKSKCYVVLPDLQLHICHIRDILRVFEKIKVSQEYLPEEPPPKKIVFSKRKEMQKLPKAIPPVKYEEIFDENNNYRPIRSKSF